MLYSDAFMEITSNVCQTENNETESDEENLVLATIEDMKAKMNFDNWF